MPNIGPMEIAIVLVIALVIFGPKRLPELGQSMGKGIREFKGSISGDKNDEKVAQIPAAEAAVAEVPVTEIPVVEKTQHPA
jgi:sec-independent protein translocase protein TatA